MTARGHDPQGDETRLRLEVQRLRQELDALHETATALADDERLDDLVSTIVVRAAGLVEGAEGLLFLLDDDGAMRLRFASGAAGRVGPIAVEPGDGVVGRVWAEGAALAINDYQSWPERQRDTHGFEIQALAATPVMGEDGVIGVLGLWHHTVKSFSPDTLTLLDRFAGLAALALERTRLRTDLDEEVAQRRRTEDELVDTVARLSGSENALRLSHEQMARRLAAASEFRDAQTSRHVERVGSIGERIARRLGLDDAFCELVRVASPLHDIGKIGVPDDVLLKPGGLDDEERRLLEGHAEIGYRILAGSGSELLDLAASIALTHHEHYDGSGYPAGLAGPEIPIEGRIAAVADVYDALTTDRAYRPAYPEDIALEMVLDGRGTRFDPDVLDAFLAELAPHLAHVPSALPLSRTRDEPVAFDVAPVSVEQLAAGAVAAVTELDAGQGPRRRINAALRRLCEATENRVIASVYVEDHNHLWCIAQVGYDQVRDGFTLDQGVLGRCVRDGRTVFLADVRDEPAFIAAMPNIVSELCVPIHGQKVRAALNLETIAARLPEGGEEAVAPLVEALAAVVDDVASPVSIDVTTMAHLFVHASSLRGVASLAEFATRTMGQLLDLEAVQLDLGTTPSGPPASFWRRPDSALRPIPANRVADALEGGLSDVTVTVADGVDVRLVDEAEGHRRILWVPLRSGDAVVGTLIGRSGDAIELDTERSDGAALLAQHMAALIEVAQALRREQRAAVTDSLTGLLNRRGFDERLGDELARAERGGMPLALVLLDCDDLKRVNDTLGHDRGDETLKALARIIRDGKRAGDIAARIGGDEFGVALPGADLEAAVLFVERLRARLGSRAGTGALTTASFGIALYPNDGLTGAALLRAADHALYDAKLGGKDRLATPA